MFWYIHEESLRPTLTLQGSIFRTNFELRICICVFLAYQNNQSSYASLMEHAFRSWLRCITIYQRCNRRHEPQFASYHRCSVAHTFLEQIYEHISLNVLQNAWPSIVTIFVMPKQPQPQHYNSTKPVRWSSKCVCCAGGTVLPQPVWICIKIWSNLINQISNPLMF